MFCFSLGCEQGRGGKESLLHAIFFLLSQKVVTALDRTWHPEHFFCAQCGAFFGPEGMAGLEACLCSSDISGGGGVTLLLWTWGGSVSASEYHPLPILRVP